MGQIDGFLKYDRALPDSRKKEERINDSNEIYLAQDESQLNEQAARCMDCGVPFCHSGCPLGNQIPDFNDAVYQKDWKLAFEVLSSTNNFPEFTGRICPAPCEASCVLNINQAPVTIEQIEKSIAEKAYELGLVVPQIPEKRTGKSVAVIGSGPAGLAAAAQLNQAGHEVTVFERDDEVGGLLRYGIPDFKLEKWVIERKVKIMQEEGIIFKTSCEVGKNIAVKQLNSQFDALVLCGGSTIPRNLPIPGRDLKGVHFAMEFLTQQNRRVANKPISGEDIFATDKNVIVIGGGDTGADCVGTSNRHKAKSITQIELLSKPPTIRGKHNPWPEWPMTLKTSSSHDEGCERDWAVLTKSFIGHNGVLTGLQLVDIQWTAQGMEEISGSERVLPCDLVFIAAGFVHPQKAGMIEQLGIELDDRRNVKTENYQTSVENVFAAGDMNRGQSLVVWALNEGREAARAVDQYLMGNSVLNVKDKALFAV